MADYAGELITGKSGETAIKPILDRLASLGYVMPAKGTFAGLIRMYQSQHVDAVGNPLRDDGVVGRATWESLFGAGATDAISSGVAALALAKAISQIGVLESPLGSNRGPQVDAFQRAAGLSLTPGKPGYYWCMAFVHWCFAEAAKDGNEVNPFPRTAGCLDAWKRVRKTSPGRIVTRDQALADPTRVRPGVVFILDHGGGMGHTGFVSQVTGAAFETIEGNSNDSGSSNGVGVFRLNRRRTTSDTLKGFIDFTAEGR